MKQLDGDIIIIGAGIGGLTLALCLHDAGIPCRVYEAAAEVLPLGVGLNLLPHAMGQLHRLGLEGQLLASGIETQEYRYFTRGGQLVQVEPRGRLAGHVRPQVSIHRADLHLALLDAVGARLGPDAVRLNHRCVGLEQDARGVTVTFTDVEGQACPPARGAAAIACDGVHSTARAKYHPEAQLRYQGTTQYRGTTRWPPFLSGATMVYLGTTAFGKLVMYPVRNDIDPEGRQLINWVIEVARPADQLLRDWNRRSEVSEFIGAFEHARFPWLDVAAVLRAAEAVYEYPMVDQDPLASWTVGRVTLLGDAAHPMMPRGSNGSAQAILDAAALTEQLLRHDTVEALKAYEAQRLKATSDVVLANRSMAPDAILEVVEERTGGRPFADIAEVIGAEELQGWQERYQRIAGFAKPPQAPEGRTR
jgi:2-polyprenyl-6-methoxyphenol hydroxylase-like FAD-dependent oxidoreductase